MKARAMLAAAAAGVATVLAPAAKAAEITVLSTIGVQSVTPDQLAPKTKDAAGKTGEMLVKGEIDIGAQQIPELMAVSGIDILGPLPGDLQVTTIFSVGIAVNAKDASAAKALVDFLAAPSAAPAFKAKGFTS